MHWLTTQPPLLSYSVVADGIIDAIGANDMKQPIVVRVMGTGADEAKRKVRQILTMVMLLPA